MANLDQELVDSKVDAALDAGADPQDIERATRGQVQVQEFAPIESPYEGREEEFVENPYENLYVPNDFNRSAMAATDATTIALSTGLEANLAYAQAKEAGASEVEAAITRLAQGELDQSYEDAVDMLAENDPEFLSENAQYIAEDMRRATERLSKDNSILADSRAVVMTYEGAEKLTDEEIDEAAVGHFTQKLISDILDKDDSFGSRFVDYFGLLAVPDLSYDMAKLQEALVEDAGFFESYINSGDFVSKFRAGLSTLEPEQRAVVLTKVAEELQDIESNELKTVIALMDLAGLSDERQAQADLALEKLDVAAFTYGLGARIVNATKRFNTLRRVTAAGDAPTAGKVVNMAVSSEEGAKAMGVSRIDAAAAIDPNTPDIEDIIKGAPTEVASSLRDELQIIDEFGNESINFVEEGLGLTDAERLAAAQARVKVLNKRADIENVVGVPTDKGIEIKFDVKDQPGVRGRYTAPYTQDDVTGGFKTDGVTFVGNLGGKILSPNALAGKDKDRLVQSFERILFQQGKVKYNFSQAIERATKGLNSKESQNVSKVLEMGDDRDKLFSYKELVHDGVGGVRLTPKEFESYAKLRRVMDNAYVIKNKEVRNTLQARGIKELHSGDNIYYAKPYDEIQSGGTAYRNSDDKYVYIPQPLKKKPSLVKSMDSETIKQYYDEGYVLMKASDNNNLFKGGATHTRWTMVKKTDIRDLSHAPVKYRPGYIPRVYKDAHFFVKQKRRLSVNGENVQAGLRTLRYFDNSADASKYIDELRESARISGEKFEADDYVVLSDREITSAELDEDSINMFGGLYTGGRGEEALKFGLAGDVGQRVDPLEAIQNYINHIGNKLPMSEYRTGIETRWLNQAKDTGFLPKNFKGGFADALPFVENAPGRVDYKNKLLQSHRQISYMTRVPTIGEQNFEGTIRSLGMALEGIETPFFKGKDFAKYIYNLNHKNPVDAIRAASFHAMLGMFNFSQVLVQGLGATIAMSISPKNGAKAIPQMLGFAMLDNIKVPSARTAAAKKMAKVEGFEQVAADYELWRKSGLFESVVNASADVGSFFRGGKTDAGSLRRILDAGTLPFKMGELANMRISFGTALNKWRSLNPGKEVDDAALRSIIAQAETFRLNMSMANKAEFQKGLLAIPFQFQQINTKFLETMLGDQLTKADKAKLILSQAGIFGAAGVPFGSYILAQYHDLIGTDISQLTEEEVIAQQRGLLGWVFNDVLDVNAVVTNRVAIPAGVIDAWVDFATTDQEVSGLLLGPTGNIYDRSATALSNFLGTAAAINPEDLDITTVSLVTEVLIKSVADIPSSTRNLMLATDMLDGSVYRDKHGSPRSIQNENAQTIFAQAMGFGNQDRADFWDLSADDRGYRTRIKDEARRIVRIYEAMFSAADNDAERAKAHKIAIQNVMSKYQIPDDRRELTRLVNQYLSFRDADPAGKLVRESLEHIASEFSSDSVRLNPLVVRKVEEANDAR